MSLTGDTEPSERHGGAPGATASAPAEVRFERRELDRILGVYGRMVADGEWRDYAIDFLKDRAVFSVFRRSSEVPIYRIEKNPKLSRRQGAVEHGKPRAHQRDDDPVVSQEVTQGRVLCGCLVASWRVAGSVATRGRAAKGRRLAATPRPKAGHPIG